VRDIARICNLLEQTLPKSAPRRSACNDRRSWSPALLNATTVDIWAAIIPGVDSSRFTVGNDTGEASARSRCSHRNKARAARISSLLKTSVGFSDAVGFERDPAPCCITNATVAALSPKSRSVEPVPVVDSGTKLARCFLRLANLPNYALDRLSRFEGILWRQVAQILFALDHLDRRIPLERRRRRSANRQQKLPAYGRDEC